MPLKVDPPREYWDDERQTWCVLYKGKRHRLSLPRSELNAARLAVAKFRVALEEDGATKLPQERSTSEVPCAEVLGRYLGRRANVDPSKVLKPVARPRELQQRIAKLHAYWRGKPVSAINTATCEEFAAYVGREAYARRCLGDMQAALNEARLAGLFREVVQVTLPPPPEPREDYLTLEEAIALVRVAWTHRDVQQRRIGGHIEVVDGKRKLVGGELTTVVGSKRPWWHMGKFVIVAIATCSRSARVFRASYDRDAARAQGLPWVDLSKGRLHRMAPGERRTKKKAPTVSISPRLVATMRRWSSDRVVGGRQVEGDRFVVEWADKPADCKKAFPLLVAETRRRYPHLFVREDGEPKEIVRHSLRHTGVTWLVENEDLTIEDVCSYAGMTKAMFERVYGHDAKQRADKIAKAQGRKRPRPRPEGRPSNLPPRDDDEDTDT